MVMQATWNGAVLAESDDTVVVENNHYFPESSLNQAYFSASQTHTVCPWKGTASYLTVTVAGETNPDAAWFYPEPSEQAAMVAGRIAFWKGVSVSQLD